MRFLLEKAGQRGSKDRRGKSPVNRDWTYSEYAGTPTLSGCPIPGLRSDSVATKILEFGSCDAATERKAVFFG